MAVTLVVPPGVLRRAGQEWDDAHERLSGARGRLGEIAPAGLSPAATGAVTDFLETWTGELAVLSRQSAMHAQAFADLDADLGVTDVVEARRLRALLPYTFHAAPIVAA